MSNSGATLYTTRGQSALQSDKIEGGSYIPAIVNIDMNVLPTLQSAHFQRVGTTVTATVRLTGGQVLGVTTSQFLIGLPLVASIDIGDASRITGVGTIGPLNTIGDETFLVADPANNVVIVDVVNANAGAQTYTRMNYVFQYSLV